MLLLVNCTDDYPSNQHQENNNISVDQISLDIVNKILIPIINESAIDNNTYINKNKSINNTVDEENSGEIRFIEVLSIYYCLE